MATVANGSDKAPDSLYDCFGRHQGTSKTNRKFLSATVLTTIASQLSAQVKALHAQGQTHRRINLDNVLFDEEQNKVQLGPVNTGLANRGLRHRRSATFKIDAKSDKAYDYDTSNSDIGLDDRRLDDEWAVGILLIELLLLQTQTGTTSGSYTAWAQALLVEVDETVKDEPAYEPVAQWLVSLLALSDSRSADSTSTASMSSSQSPSSVASLSLASPVACTSTEDHKAITSKPSTTTLTSQ
jgi:hypothetical protein